jgi:hypothetical protein
MPAEVEVVLLMTIEVIAFYVQGPSIRTEMLVLEVLEVEAMVEPMGQTKLVQIMEEDKMV